MTRLVCASRLMGRPPNPLQGEEIEEIAGWIGPDRVHLNTVVRPPAETFAVPVTQDLMECFATAFGDNAKVIGVCKDLPHGGQ